GEVDRMPVLELPVALSGRGADDIDDHCGGHAEAPSGELDRSVKSQLPGVENRNLARGARSWVVADPVSSDELARIERLSRLLGLQTLLAHVAREIGPALEVQPVLRSVLGAMRSLMDFRGGAILLVEQGELYIAASDP